MKKTLLVITVLMVGGSLSGCNTYEERIIDEGTVIEQRMIVE